MSAVANTIDHDGDDQMNIDHPMNDQGVNNVNWRLTCLKDFQKLNPHNFARTTEPLEAESWLKQMKKKLDVLRIPEDFRMEFAAYLFVGEADHWWDYIRRIDNVETMTWANFEKTFYGKYFPQTVRNAKLKEFVELTQGNLTVTQYEGKFTQLSCYAPLLVANEENKTNRFTDGLIRLIRKIIVALGLTVYKEAMAATLRIEQEHNDHMAKQAKNKALSNSGRKITRITDYSGQKGGNKGSSSNSYFRNPRPSPYSCFKCGQPGHLQHQCPQKSSVTTIVIYFLREARAQPTTL
ncbi:hypothetical protein ACFX1T_033989 [Malus domestica]